MNHLGLININNTIGFSPKRVMNMKNRSNPLDEEEERTGTLIGRALLMDFKCFTKLNRKNCHGHLSREPYLTERE